MSACKNAIDNLGKLLSLNKKHLPNIKVKKKKLIKFSSYKEFNDLAIKRYLNVKI